MTDRPAITQAMINCHDEYTHLTLDRRGFMQKLTGLAGSAAAAAAIAPLLAASNAQAAIVPENDPGIEAVWTTFPVGKAEMRGYLVRPAGVDKSLPGVVVIHENRGLNGHIQDVARRMAAAGFIALAPDFLSGAGGTPPDEDKARDMIGSLDPGETVTLAKGAADWLAGADGVDGKVGAVGFCWGGGLVNDLAVADPKLRAGVAYYGRQPKAEDVSKIKAAMMLHYGGLDERINAGIDSYRNAMEKAGTVHQIFIYQGVNHAFNNDTSAARYDKAASDLAWQRTTEFLKAKLT